jgi:ABC-2 type transport system permease protein
VEGQVSVAAVTPPPKNRSVVQDLGLIGLQFKFEPRGFLRNTQARFFTIILPVVFLVIFVSIFGNHTVPLSHHGARIKQSTYYIPALTSLGIISAAFTNLVIAVVTQRESGILKRRRSAPVPAYVLILGRALVSVVLALFMCALMMGIGSIFYGATVPSHTFPGVAVAAILGALMFCTVGYAVATFIGSADAAQPIVQITLLPLYFISGVFVPQSQIPSWLGNVAAVFPVKHLSAALIKAYVPTTTGAGFSGGDLAVLAAWGVGGLIVALWHFSWCPRGR